MTTRQPRSGLTLREFLIATEQHGFHAHERLVAAGYHPNVVYAKAEKAARRNYIEYGVSLRGAWLTDKGREYLAARS